MTLDLISRAEALRTARIDQLEQWKALQQKAPGMIATIGDKITRLDEFLRTARQLANIDDDKFDAGLASLVESPAPIQPETATKSADASQERAQTATGLGAGGDNLDQGSRPTATAKTDVPFQGQASGGGQSQDNSGVRVASVDTNSNSVSTEPPSPLTEAGEGGPSLPALPGDPSSETPEPITLIDRIEQKPTLKQMVSACFDEHPDWTARQIAEKIGRPLTSVQTTLRAVRRERDAQTEPGEHHTLAAATIDEDNEPVDIPAVRRPRPVGERFYLRDKDGRFLHQAVTRDRDGAPLFIEKRIYGWFGTEANFQNVLKILPEVAGLRKEVPEK